MNISPLLLVAAFPLSMLGQDLFSPKALPIPSSKAELADLLLSDFPRPKTANLEYIDWIPGPRAEAPTFAVYQVRWQAIGPVFGVGLLLLPHEAPLLNVIALPDPSQLPEDLCGLPPYSLPHCSPFALQLAQAGCRVLVPLTLPPQTSPHLLSLETQKILAAVDALKQMIPRSTSRKVAAVGWNRGAQLAFLSATLDQRIHAAAGGGLTAAQRSHLKAFPQANASFLWDAPEPGEFAMGGALLKALFLACDLSQEEIPEVEDVYLKAIASLPNHDIIEERIGTQKTELKLFQAWRVLEEDHPLE